MRILEFTIFKKLNSATLYNILFVDDSQAKNYRNHWNEEIHPSTYKPKLKFDNNYLLNPLLEWLKRLVASNNKSRVCC